MGNDKNLAMVAYTQLSIDGRVQRAAKAAAKAGFIVDLYTLNESEKTKKSLRLDNVNIIRCSLFQHRSSNVWNYVLAYLQFFFFCFVKISIQHLRNPYQVCHIHNMPNFLVYTCFLPKLKKAKLILDIHDLMPEIMEQRIGKKNLVPLMRLEERWSANFADLIITVNDLLIERFKKNNIKRPINIILNAPEREIIPNIEKDFTTNPIKIVYAAELLKNKGIELLLYSMKNLAGKTTNFKLYIYGDGEHRPALVQLAKKLELFKFVYFSNKLLNRQELFEEYKTSHIGILPTLRSGFTNYSYASKISEYFATKTASVISNTDTNQYYFSDAALFFKSEDPEDLADKIFYLMNNRPKIEDLVEKGYKYFMENSWEKYEQKYIDILASTINGQV